jgi:UDP-N-acetylmuramoyl-tripeptide--D-alanyl-D-alanine ligase
MSALWSSQDMEAATLGRASRAFDATGLSIDTRTLKPGDMFVALKGDNRDGHEFVRAAFEAKASGALVTHRPKGVSGDHPLLTVGHTQRALEDLGRASRARSNAKIVAVTGSAGKTTTKELLRLALSALGTTHCSAASYNNHWGVPLSLASMPRDARYGVFEIGMNHFGEIRALSGFVRPHVALITTIAPAHLEFFGNCDAIADAKAEIFEAIAPGGAALIPGDIAETERLVRRAHQAGVSRIHTFGRSDDCDARILEVDDSGGVMRLRADICGKPVEAKIGAPGAHIAANTVGALAAVMQLDGDVLNAAASLKNFSALKGRGARFDVGGIHVIDESYNANPASMAVALAMLANVRGRRIAVLGDMLELGPESPRLHGELASAVDAAHVDIVFASGPLMKSLWDALPKGRRGAYATRSTELLPSVLGALREGDTVLVKGSNGSKMGVIVEALRAREG